MSSEEGFESGYTYTIETPLKRPIDDNLSPSAENENPSSRI